MCVGQWCSISVLCFGAVSSLLALAMVSLGVTTDHWTKINVDRSLVAEMKESNNTGMEFYTRTTGLLRICFPDDDKPPEGTEGLFLTLVDDWCFYREYHLKSIMSGKLLPEDISHQGAVQIHLQRTAPLLFAVYLLGMVLTGLLGLCGCWQQSANKLILTAALQLFAALIGACGMATWHAALFFEMEKVHDDGYPLTWPDWLQRATSVETSWSYLLTWCGVCLTLVASLTTSAAAICLRSQKRVWEENSMRMKLKMSSLFAQHAYFPAEVPVPNQAYSETGSYRGYPGMHSNYPTMPANYPTHTGGHRHSDFDETDSQQMVNYNRVIRQMEISRL